MIDLTLVELIGVVIVFIVGYLLGGYHIYCKMDWDRRNAFYEYWGKLEDDDDATYDVDINRGKRWYHWLWRRPK